MPSARRRRRRFREASPRGDLRPHRRAREARAGQGDPSRILGPDGRARPDPGESRGAVLRDRAEGRGRVSLGGDEDTDLHAGGAPPVEHRVPRHDRGRPLTRRPDARKAVRVRIPDAAPSPRRRELVPQVRAFRLSRRSRPALQPARRGAGRRARSPGLVFPLGIHASDAGWSRRALEGERSSGLRRFRGQARKGAGGRGSRRRDRDLARPILEQAMGPQERGDRRLRNENDASRREQARGPVRQRPHRPLARARALRGRSALRERVRSGRRQPALHPRSRGSEVVRGQRARRGRHGEGEGSSRRAPQGLEGEGRGRGRRGRRGGRAGERPLPAIPGGLGEPARVLGGRVEPRRRRLLAQTGPHVRGARRRGLEVGRRPDARLLVDRRDRKLAPERVREPRGGARRLGGVGIGVGVRRSRAPVPRAQPEDDEDLGGAREARRSPRDVSAPREGQLRRRPRQR